MKPSPAIFLALVAILVWPFRQVSAHGGGTPQLAYSPAGSYRVSAYTAPDPLRVGDVHITVAVVEGEVDELILDAEVTLEIECLDHPADAIMVPATHGNAENKLFYEADVLVDTPGEWRVTIFIDGPLGSGETGFQFKVLQKPLVNLPTAAVFISLVVIIGFITLSRKRSAASQPKENETI